MLEIVPELLTGQFDIIKFFIIVKIKLKELGLKLTLTKINYLFPTYTTQARIKLHFDPYNLILATNHFDFDIYGFHFKITNEWR